MSIRTRLEIILKAGDTIVAVSDDSRLWQEVLAAINSGEQLRQQTNQAVAEVASSFAPERGQSGSVTAFAKQLNVPIEILIGACSPISEAPYIHLDKHHWESFKKNIPSKGPYSISPSAVAATLLCLWADIGELDKPSTKSVNMVLDTIDLTDTNVPRGIKNCEWLQLRSKTIVLNPGKISKAIAIARAYCLEEPLPSQ